MANYAYACVNTYATNRSQPLLLQCCKCGQNVHEPCLKGLLGIEVAHLSSANVMTLINPLKIPSLHFFCHRCSDTNIPQSTDGLKKSALTKSKNETPKTNINVHVNVDNSTEKNLPEMQISLVDKQIDNSHAALEKNVEPVVEVSKVCSFYKRGICKHGKKGSECRFSHPSYCKPLLMHGTHPVHGCIKGKECTDLHPKMCYSSLNKKQCFNEKCPFFMSRVQNDNTAAVEVNCITKQTNKNIHLQIVPIQMVLIILLEMAVIIIVIHLIFYMQ